MAKYAVIRKDLREAKLRVPIDDEEKYIGPDGHWEYRWLEGDVFEIKTDGEWKVADSADFDFSNEDL